MILQICQDLCSMREHRWVCIPLALALRRVTAPRKAEDNPRSSDAIVGWRAKPGRKVALTNRQVGINRNLYTDVPRPATDQIEISRPLLFSSVPFHLFLPPFLLYSPFLLSPSSFPFSPPTINSFSSFEQILRRIRTTRNENVYSEEDWFRFFLPLVVNVSPSRTRRVARFCVHGIYNSDPLIRFDDTRDKLARGTRSKSQFDLSPASKVERNFRFPSIEV